MLKMYLRNLEIKNFGWFVKFSDTSRNFNTSYSKFQGSYWRESNSHRFLSIEIKFPSIKRMGIWFQSIGIRLPSIKIDGNLICIDTNPKSRQKTQKMTSSPYPWKLQCPSSQRPRATSSTQRSSLPSSPLAPNYPHSHRPPPSPRAPLLTNANSFPPKTLSTSTSNPSMVLSSIVSLRSLQSPPSPLSLRLFSPTAMANE